MVALTDDELHAMDLSAELANALGRIVGDGPTYVSFDVDGLDPVYCIGTGVPEPGGLSMRDAQVIIRGLQGMNLIGGDVCEVLPLADPSGHTALNAANLMFEMLCVIADSRVNRKP